MGWLDGARGHREGPGSSYEEAQNWGVLAYSVRQSQTLQNLKDREVATTEGHGPTCTSTTATPAFVLLRQERGSDGNRHASCGYTLCAGGGGFGLTVASFRCYQCRPPTGTLCTATSSTASSPLCPIIACARTADFTTYGGLHQTCMTFAPQAVGSKGRQ